VEGLAAAAAAEGAEVEVVARPLGIHPMKSNITGSTMKNSLQSIWRITTFGVGSALLSSLLLLLNLHLPFTSCAEESRRNFATPEAAVAALAEAVKTHDQGALKAIFGPDVEEVENPDRIQATNEWIAFSAALEQGSHLSHESNTNCVLEVGTNSWPFPIPIVKQNGRWLFDTEAGQDELLNRRIGRNELATLQVMRAYLEAQREYASRDHDGDQVLEFAQKLNSSPGTHDGLYWEPGPDGEISPLGPLVAYAQGEGYELASSDDDDEVPGPFHGYYYRILTRQGKHAPGGKYDYVINGNMIGGFALIAWPASYGESGIMTFIVNQQGRVYQKDLGSKTAKMVGRIKEYDPDSTWVPSPD